MHILNIVLDEKFIDNVIHYHDLTNNLVSHHYLTLNIRNKRDFKYIKNKDRIIQCRPYKFLSYIKKVHYDAIIIHNLISIPSKLVQKIPVTIPVFWISWGMDIYSLPKGKPIVPLHLHHPLTVNEIRQNRKSSFNIFPQIKLLITRIIKGESLFSHYRHADYLNAIKRINYFSGIIPDEYDYLIEKPFFTAKNFRYQYINPNTFNSKPPLQSKHKQIIIGNSAVYTNNHLDVFEILKNLNLDEYTIILPINYGGNQEYCKKLISKGYRLWKEQFHPITNFIPLDQYNSMLDQCSHAIFYHERQQAMGNIYRLLESGCKVFLSESNLTFKYLSKLGLKIFSIQSDLNQQNIDTPLQLPDAIANQQIIYNLRRDKETAIKRLTDIYTTITEFHLHNDQK